MLKIIILISTILLMSIGIVGASELSDYHALIDQASNQGYSSQKLDDMAYKYGSLKNLITRMDVLENQPKYVINSYFKYNPLTRNLEWSGYRGNIEYLN